MKTFMQSLVIKDYIPLLQTIVGGFLTFLGGLLGNVLIQQRQRKAERNSLSSAFYGEIQALVKIIERRQYIQGIQRAINDARSGREISLRIRVTRKYFNVYEKNLDKIGILPNPLPEKIVNIYTVMTTILEDLDFINDESFNERGSEFAAQFLVELESLLNDAVKSGHEICKEIKYRKLLEI
jgi:hypothetical protein